MVLLDVLGMIRYAEILGAINPKEALSFFASCTIYRRFRRK